MLKLKNNLEVKYKYKKCLELKDMYIKCLDNSRNFSIEDLKYNIENIDIYRCKYIKNILYYYDCEIKF